MGDIRGPNDVRGCAFFDFTDSDFSRASDGRWNFPGGTESEPGSGGESEEEKLLDSIWANGIAAETSPRC